MPSTLTRYATLSVDLDNLWAYLRTRGDSQWSTYPSFLHIAIPRLLEVFASRDLCATVFVIGQDLEVANNADVVRSIADAGHELGNHSFSHAVDFHTFAPETIDDEIGRTEHALRALDGVKPRGFRGPSFRLSTNILHCLSAREYAYDASTFPSVIGPLARSYHFRTATLSDAEKARQRALFGSFAEARRPLVPYLFELDQRQLLEIPVTTLPFLRLPMHLTYLNFIADYAPRAALAYFHQALSLCRYRNVAPSLLVHATDVIGCDDKPCPRFLPGMRRDHHAKIRFLSSVLAALQQSYAVQPLGSYAAQIVRQSSLTRVAPIFDS